MVPVEALLILVLSLPFVAGLCCLFFPTNARNLSASLATFVGVVGFAAAIALYPHVQDGAVLRYAIPWAPSLRIDLGLRMDGFAWLFVALITGIGALVTLYARVYMSPEDPVPRFFGYLLAFMGSMLGIVLSANLIQLVFFWEMTSLFSFLLIGYWYKSRAARDGARMALIITSAGGFCMLAGVFLIGRIVGGFGLDTVLAAGPVIRAHPLYLPALILILTGALTKSAQFPFHFWLPQAMSAPTPVSAFLHSATMVKAGVFLMARLYPALGGTDAWFVIVGGAGAITLTLGAYAALFQNDLKGLLAYSTISHLGLITLLLGIGTPYSVVAAVFHLVNHAVFKAALFMIAGVVDHEAGTRDIRKLGGLLRLMPWTGGLAIAASAAMAGVPLMNGFISKEMFFAETLTIHRNALIDFAPAMLALIAGALGVAYSLRFILPVFFGPQCADTPKPAHDPPRLMLLPIQILVFVCLAVGVIPMATFGGFLATASAGILGGEAPAVKLAVWHGFNLPLAMTAVAFAVGGALYAVLAPRFAGRPDGAPVIGRISGRRIFERGLELLVSTSALVDSRLIRSRLQRHLLFILVAALALAALAMGSAPSAFETVGWSSIDPGFGALWLIGAACAVGAAVQAKFHRLVALVLTGGAGLITCISFVWLSAPDLAATQLLVEVVTLILILLGLRWLPKRSPLFERGGALARFRRRRDLAVAIGSGFGMAALAFGVMNHPVSDNVSRFFLENAYSQGGGRNVVNVILVDFRAFDTMGEITVLGVVGLTVYALLRRFRPATESVEAPAQQRIQSKALAERPDDKAAGAAHYMLIPGLIIKLMSPLILLFGIHLFMRGHDLPGGGFAAGITISTALILLYVAGGVRWVEQRLNVSPVSWIASGLLLAAATGVGSLAFGHPFLTTYFQYVQIPLIGKIPAATALLFDLGVMVLVVGATSLILIALAHQSLRRPRKPDPDAVEAGEGI